MSDPREKLANHLTAHGVPLELGIRSTDTQDDLHGTDWAILLGMIEPRQAAMMMAKYLDDELELLKCRAWWLADCIEYAALRDWKRPRARMIEAMAYATMNEHMGHGTRCQTCNGTRERMVGNLPVVCPSCNGAGFPQYSAERYCDEIGITLLEWDRTWRERVGWSRRALFIWEMEAKEALRKKAG